MQIENIKSSNCSYFPKCGGCSLLHLSQDQYRNFKKEFLTDLLKNFKIQLNKEPEWIWIAEHSRRKITFQINQKNLLGFFATKSKNIVEIKNCFIANPAINSLIEPLQQFLKSQEQGLFQQAIITSFDNSIDLVFVVKKDLNFLQIQKAISFAKEQNLNLSYKIKDTSTPVFLSKKNQIFYPDFKINLTSDIFIQATKSGLKAITQIIQNEIKGFSNIADIYAGFGAYSFAIVNLAKNILAFEGDQKMVDLVNKNASENNLTNKIKAKLRDIFANPLDKNELKNFDAIIINPPRNGASPQILEIAKSNVKKLIYVSCNPQSFLRDAQILIDSSFKIKNLTALDQFYGNKHLEIIATFENIKND